MLTTQGVVTGSLLFSPQIFSLGHFITPWFLVPPKIPSKPQFWTSTQICLVRFQTHCTTTKYLHSDALTPLQDSNSTYPQVNPSSPKTYSPLLYKRHLHLHSLSQNPGSHWLLFRSHSWHPIITRCSSLCLLFSSYSTRFSIPMIIPLL